MLTDTTCCGVRQRIGSFEEITTDWLNDSLICSANACHEKKHTHYKKTEQNMLQHCRTVMTKLEINSNSHNSLSQSFH